MLPRTAAAVVAGAATRSAFAAMGEGTGDAGPLGRAALVLAVAATVGLAWYVVRAIRRAMAR
jgi:hypothetical protein